MKNTTIKKSGTELESINLEPSDFLYYEGDGYGKVLGKPIFGSAHGS